MTVTGSGDWVAEILKDNDFSFNPNSSLYRIEGTSGDSFNIYARTHNTTGDIRYWFVKIYLKDRPSVSRYLVIAQQG
ncbi:MAG: hypothetical protein LIP01_04225 [Tannerellaceae bacterium]|nr:hypothetical protein [Tannerellaceae bacterium]